MPQGRSPGTIHQSLAGTWQTDVLISVNLTSGTAEASDSASQTVRAFGDVLARLGGAPLALSRIDRLAFCLTIGHPIVAARSVRASGSYRASTGTFYATARLNYAAWIKPDWASRVEAVGLGLTEAAAAIHKTRITEAERSQVLALIAEAQRRVASDPPETMLHLQPIELTYFPGRSEPMISFGRSPTRMAGSERTIMLPPEKIDEYLLSLPRKPTEPRPGMFKRYRRSSGVIEYREAWPADEVVIEHWGACGERGQTCEHPTPTARDQLNTLKGLKAKAAALGFKPISLSRHAKVVVQRSVAGIGTPQDLDERHDLEAFLDEQTGWLGLGHCDGGSIGSGSMEAVCYVVDAGVARSALARELATSRFSAWRIDVLSGKQGSG